MTIKTPQPDMEVTPQDLLASFKSAFGNGLKGGEVRSALSGSLKTPRYSIWLRVERALLRPAMQHLIAIAYPHLAVIAGNDLGDEIELLYILSVFLGKKHGEYMVTIAISLPKSDLVVPTIADLLPGAVFSEREKQEFFGITVENIPDGRRLFLPDDFPLGVYPWRKDETGIQPGMVKELWKTNRPTDRPAPPVPEKEPAPKESGGSTTESDRSEPLKGGGNL